MSSYADRAYKWDNYDNLFNQRHLCDNHIIYCHLENGIYFVIPTSVQHVTTKVIEANSAVGISELWRLLGGHQYIQRVPENSIISQKNNSAQNTHRKIAIQITHADNLTPHL